MTVLALDTNILLRLVHTGAPEHRICQDAVRELTVLGAELQQVAVGLWVVGRAA